IGGTRGHGGPAGSAVALFGSIGIGDWIGPGKSPATGRRPASRGYPARAKDPVRLGGCFVGILVRAAPEHNGRRRDQQGRRKYGFRKSHILILTHCYR